MAPRINPPVAYADVAPAFPPVAATAGWGHSGGETFTALLFVTAGILAACFIFLIYYAVLLRQRSARRRRRRSVHRRSRVAAAAAFTDDSDEEEGGDLPHIWCIRNEGLGDDIIKSIAVVAHKRGANGDDGSGNCSVCLSEFKEGELIRVLPKCWHGFHVPCIDPWLRSHINCPLCRAPVVTVVVDAPQSDSDHSFSIENFSSNALPLEEEDSIARVVPLPGPSLVLDQSNAVADNDQSVMIGLGTNEGLHMVRRTVSMDCSVIGNHSRSQASEIGFQLEGNLKEPVPRQRTSLVIGEEEEYDTDVGSSERNKCEIERSASSSSSGPFFLSILGRSRSNAILPL